MNDQSTVGALIGVICFVLRINEANKWAAINDSVPRSPFIRSEGFGITQKRVGSNFVGGGCARIVPEIGPHG